MTASPDPLAESQELLADLRRIRREARRARHAYWLPLLLFGVLIGGSIPFYWQPSPHSGLAIAADRTGLAGALDRTYLGAGPLSWRGSPYYWLPAILAGVILTVAWYRWRGGRAGVTTPSRGYLGAGLVLLALAIAVPLVVLQLARRGGPVPLLPADLLVRGLFPLIIIAIGLCVLAIVERSTALTVIVACFLGLSLLVSLYDLSNVLARAGWIVSPAAQTVPNVVLPALLLIVAGAAAGLAGLRRQRRAATAASAGGPPA